MMCFNVACGDSPTLAHKEGDIRPGLCRTAVLEPFDEGVDIYEYD